MSIKFFKLFTIIKANSGDVAHPINAETRKMIEDEVIAKYKEECQ